MLAFPVASPGLVAFVSVPAAPSYDQKGLQPRLDMPSPPIAWGFTLGKQNVNVAPSGLPGPADKKLHL